MTTRSLARIAIEGSITLSTAQDLRDLSLLDGYPNSVTTLGAITEGDGGGGTWNPFGVIS